MDSTKQYAVRIQFYIDEENDAQAMKRTIELREKLEEITGGKAMISDLVKLGKDEPRATPVKYEALALFHK